RTAAPALAVTTLALLFTAPVAVANHPAPFLSPLGIPPVLASSNIDITAEEADVPIFAGTPTRMWTYNGTFPGPTIRRPTGTVTHITFRNNLPAAAGSLSFHNHGNHSSSDNDGQPSSFLVAPGATRN